MDHYPLLFKLNMNNNKIRVSSVKLNTEDLTRINSLSQSETGTRVKLSMLRMQRMLQTI